MKPYYETKMINLTYMDPDNPLYYEEFIPFGWEHTDTIVKGISEYAILVRDRNMPHYQEIKELDEQYFALRESKKAYHGRFVFSTFLLCLIFFVVPGILYIGYKLTARRRIEKYNEGIQKQMDTIVEQATKLLEEPLEEEQEDKEKEEEEPSTENPEQCQK